MKIRFSLRFFLIFSIVIGVLGGLWMREQAITSTAINRIIQAGGNVNLRRNWPSKLIPSHTPIVIFFPEPIVDDSVFEMIGKFKVIENLGLIPKPEQESLLRKLCAASSIRRIEFEDAYDDAIETVVASRGIESISISGHRFTGKGLASLAVLVHLSALDLSRTSFSDLFIGDLN